MATSVPSAGAFAADIVVDPFVGFEDARAQGLGGANVALTDDFYSMFVNPASLVDAKPIFAASRLDLGVAGPIFDIAAAALGGGDILTTVQDLLAANNYQVYTALDISGPLSIGYRGDGLGFGAFATTHVVVDVASASSMTVDVSQDLLITGGYAFRVPLKNQHVLDFGLLAKGFIRGSMGLDGGVVDLMGLMSDPTSLIGQPFTMVSGVGLDLGMLWDWAGIVSAGLVCRDAFSPALISTYDNIAALASSDVPNSTDQGLIDPNLELGVKVRPPLGKLSGIFDDMIILLDYERLLDFAKPYYRNPILNLKMGLEVRVLEVLTLRTGYGEGLLHAGAEFDLGFARIGATAWGEELGFEPGQRPVYNLLLSMDFVY